LSRAVAGHERSEPESLGRPESIVVSVGPENDSLDDLRFGFSSSGKKTSQPNRFIIPLISLSGDYVTENWSLGEVIASGVESGVEYFRSTDYLFVHLAVNFPSDNVELGVADAYNQLLGFTRSAGYEYPIRAWNFLPDINKGEEDEERYRRFSVGRGQAFNQAGFTEEQFPAATAIGSAKGSDMHLLLISAKCSVPMLGNARQIDAYKYPAIYGPCSPSFSRAAIVQGDTGGLLIVSGTASVVGHKSMHHDDILAQAKEICENIRQLLKDAEAATCCAIKPDSRSVFRIYLRRPEYLESVQNIHKEYFPDSSVIFLQGDICRSELLIETEAVVPF
jgi:chorismate lyase/3-hydroxybenzoate synthase